MHNFGFPAPDFVWHGFIHKGDVLWLRAAHYADFAEKAAAHGLWWINGKKPTEWNPFDHGAQPSEQGYIGVRVWCGWIDFVGQPNARQILFGSHDGAGAEKPVKKKEDAAVMEIKINMENLSSAERNHLMRMIEKANPSSSIPRVWPMPDDIVWAVNGSGVVFSNTARQMNPKRLEYLKKTNRLFKTKEDAERAVERAKVLGEMEKLADKGGGEKRHIIGVACDGSVMILEMENFTAAGIPNFSTAEAASTAIEKIGAERIAKYLMG